MAIHGIDWIHWLTGGRIAEVAAFHTTQGNRGHGEMESSGACVFRLANSGCATLGFDSFRPGAAPGHGDDRLQVAGERGVLEVAGGETTLLTHDRGPCRLEKEEPLSLFEEFDPAHRGGAAMRITAEEAFAVSELALRCRDAADTKTIVSLGRAQ